MIRYLYTRTIIAFACLALALTACKDEEIVGDMVGNSTSLDEFWEQYDFVLGQNNYTTRVSYTDETASLFDNEDVVGVFTVHSDNQEVNGYSNIPYSVLTVTSTSGETRQVLLPAGAEQIEKNNAYRYVLYYPYQESMKLADLEAYSHTVQTTQNTEEAFEASDLLWCYYTPPTDESATYVIDFDHAMAQIVVVVGGMYRDNVTDTENDVRLLAMAYEATGINLVQEWSDSFSYDTDESGKQNITPWLYDDGDTESNSLRYRACVPIQTIKEGTSLVRIGETNYSIGQDLTLKAGYTYTLTLNKDGLTDIEISDDDSWVLDVYDPVTHKLVGLLCREYLRYQPGHNNASEVDHVTGKDGNTYYINSQAWVFYKLQSDGVTPELSEGQVMRFIYDIHASLNETNAFQAKSSIWPLPHTQSSQYSTHQGLFTPEHGFQWITSPETANGGYYGISSSEVDEAMLADDEKEQNYYMHGGTITWDTTTGTEITGFTPMDNAPTNDQAKRYGHIAIDEKGDAFVSYSPERNKTYDEDGNKIGIVEHRYLIDNRNDGSGNYIETKYPLVKIGYNQFWISKAFEAKTLTDGTALTCYNKEGADEGNKPASVSFEVGGGTDVLKEGFIYPCAQNVASDEGNIPYDPYNDPEEMKGGDGLDGRECSYKPVPLYNTIAIDNKNFVPQPPSGATYQYFMPTKDEINQMLTYFGYKYAAKLMTREISRRTDVNLSEGSFPYKKYIALRRGEIYQETTDSYTANISGFNLRALGHFIGSGSDTYVSSLGTNESIILKGTPPYQVAYLDFMPHNAWANTNTEILKVLDYTQNSSNASYSKFFAPVRLLMTFDKPSEKTTAGNSITGYSTKSVSTSGSRQNNRNVYVTLQAE